MIPGLTWIRVGKRDPRAIDLYARHYSSAKNGKTADHWRAAGIVAPGESITLLTPDARALFVWIRQRYRLDGERGINCAVFRNEGDRLSSDLIRAAEILAWQRWPGQRLYTYVDPGAIRSPNPGACFLRAGWRRLPDRTAKGLVVLEKLPDLEHAEDHRTDGHSTNPRVIE